MRILFTTYPFAHEDAAVFISDGTQDGTTLLLRRVPGGRNAVGNYLPLGNGLTLFTDYDHGYSQTWVTNGTVLGTILLALNTIPQSTTSSYNENLVSLSTGFGLFRHNDGAHGSELWITDGTSAGTTLLTDINPGSGSSNPQILSTGLFWQSGLTNINGRVLFSADDGTHGRELFVTDGTSAGTLLIADINPNGSSDPINFFNLGNDSTLFWADDGVHGSELWITDGTESGTHIVSDINPSPGASSGNYVSFVSAGNGRAAFLADDGVSGLQIWISDGSEAGTHRVDSDAVHFSRIHDLTYIGDGRFLFGGNDGVSGDELWVSDGASSSTRLVRDINPGIEPGDPRFSLPPSANSSFPSGFTALYDGNFVFGANDGTHGTELWITDGTTAGTRLVHDISPGSREDIFNYPFGIQPISSSPRDFLSLGDGSVVFQAAGMPWITNGTEAGTRLIATMPELMGSSNFTVFDGYRNPAYRFYNMQTGDHFYTTSLQEANILQGTAAEVYRFEGAPWSTPDEGPDTTDVFRFYNVETGEHFYTNSTVERDLIVSADNSYRYEGVAFESYATSEGADRITLERFYNTQTGLHHFSANADESAWIRAGNAGAGWVYEGLGFTVVSPT